MEPERVIFVEGIVHLVEPHLDEILKGFKTSGEFERDLKTVHVLLLSKFYSIAQEDSAVSMYMIPIMAFLSKEAKERKKRTRLGGAPSEIDKDKGK